ncbi:hypothetical protein HSBAA_19940 [Vreelandella sulfidaeris]|uniref:Uncharacterized protein n=1 Tax=Vreelandella sulfidaeris TaxID=115553 RepID=A0A455U8V6_9GAMM|nr:hypothetical protein HSBAA_19940 [Halomonas sulfidaeris]
MNRRSPISLRSLAPDVVIKTIEASFHTGLPNVSDTAVPFGLGAGRRGTSRKDEDMRLWGIH